jgi:hypothetical protein
LRMRKNRLADNLVWVLKKNEKKHTISDPMIGRTADGCYSRIDEFRKRVLSGQQRELDLDNSDLRRPAKEQILQQPHGHRILQHRHVPRAPRAGDRATVHDRPPGRALFRDDKRDVRRDRKRRAVGGRRWAEHAAGKDNLSGRARFCGNGRFLRRLLIDRKRFITS